MIRTVIADDEPLIRNFLRTALARESDLQVVAECADGDATVEALRAGPVDVVFLDVQMPGRDGFEVIRTVGVEAMPLVVFVTAFDEYAIRAFECHAIDYLLKPFDEDRVAAAVRQVRSRLAERDRGRLAERLEQVLASRDAGPAGARRIAVRCGQKIELVDVAAIDWIEADSNYVTIHAGKRTHVIRETLGEVERRLDPGRFARVHRSFVVNLSRIAELHPLFHGEYELVLTDGARIQTGRTYHDVVRRLLRGA